jgi:hypothetical protein
MADASTTRRETTVVIKMAADGDGKATTATVPMAGTATAPATISRRPTHSAIFHHTWHSKLQRTAFRLMVRRRRSHRQASRRVCHHRLCIISSRATVAVLTTEDRATAGMVATDIREVAAGTEEEEAIKAGAGVEVVEGDTKCLP